VAITAIPDVATTSTTSPRPRRRRNAGRVPPVVLVLVFVPFLAEAVWVFWPAIQGIALSFTRWDGIGPARPVGLQNFADMPSDPIFQQALRNTAIWLVLYGGLSIVLALGLALLLNAQRRGVAFYRALIFLPVVFSLVVTALVWRVIYAPDGIINEALGAVGLESAQHIWLGDPSTVLYALIVASLWQGIGYTMVLFLAGLKAVDPALTEAARVDGAGAFRIFRDVTLPQLRPVMGVVVSVTIINSLRSFDIVWSLTQGGPFNSSELLSTYMFSAAFQSRQLGYASALAVVIFVLALSFIIFYLIRILREDS
jgi:multiple sugar transport system permease protein/raffinose/stachyose/melibiose transport system permease protein